MIFNVVKRMRMMRKDYNGNDDDDDDDDYDEEDLNTEAERDGKSDEDEEGRETGQDKSTRAGALRISCKKIKPRSVKWWKWWCIKSESYDSAQRGGGEGSPTPDGKILKFQVFLRLP